MNWECKACHGTITDGERATNYQGDLIHVKCEREHSLRKQGRTFKCPKCVSSGKIDSKIETRNEEVKLKPGEVPDCAYGDCRGCHYCRNNVKLVTVPVKLRCDLCEGYGFTKTEATPVMTITDWKL